MKKLILVSPKNRTVYNFRGDLIRQFQSEGYEVVVTGPNRDDIDKVTALGVRFVEVPMAKNGTNPFILLYMGTQNFSQNKNLQSKTESDPKSPIKCKDKRENACLAIVPIIQAETVLTKYDNK